MRIKAAHGAGGALGGFKGPDPNGLHEEACPRALHS